MGVGVQEIGALRKRSLVWDLHRRFLLQLGTALRPQPQLLRCPLSTFLTVGLSKPWEGRPLYTTPSQSAWKLFQREACVPGAVTRAI